MIQLYHKLASSDGVVSSTVNTVDRLNAIIYIWAGVCIAFAVLKEVSMVA